MSEPTYTITTKHDPDPRFPNVSWLAVATRISDGTEVTSVYADTEEHAVETIRARLRIVGTEREAGHTFFADENGDECEAVTA